MKIKSHLKWHVLTQILLTAIFHFLFTEIHAQAVKQDNVILPSPSAAEIGRFGVVPVGLFTGAIQNEIPIYELGNANLKLPISLHYSSNGFVVDKTASTVGYDWSLNAGGVISRYVNGIQDFPNRLTNDFGSLINYSDEQKYDWLKIYDPVDMFSFTLPGYSGTFYLDKNGKPMIVKNQDNLTIDFNNTEKFTITTSEGVKYVFADFVPGLTQKFESWYLSSIIHPSGNQIDFKYTAVKSAQPLILNREVYLAIKDEDKLLGGQYSKEEFVGIATADRYLESIDFKGVGSVVFTNSYDRPDSKSDPKIDKITVFDGLGEQVRSVKLRYLFPKNNSAYDIKLTYPNSDQHYKYRMFLYRVEFNDKTDNKIYEYAFTYNNLNNLPPRYSYSKDFWGYFNGKLNGDIINKNDFTWLSSFDPVAYSVFGNIMNSTNRSSNLCDRSADNNFSQNGMLSQIKYPTGGYSNIYYEAHRDGKNKEVGGCRIERVETFSSNSATPEIKAYKYPKVTINYGDREVYSTYRLHDYPYTHIHQYPCHGTICWDITYSTAYWLEISPDLQGNNSTGGYHLCYGEVDIWHGINGENGTEEHEFRAVAPQASVPIQRAQVYTPLKYFNNDLFNGIPIRETIKKNNKVQKEIVYNYDFENTKYLKTLVCNNMYYNTRGDKDCLGGMYLCDYTDAEKLTFFDITRYDIYSNFPYLTSKKETITDDNSQTVTTESFYDYCPAPYTNIRSVRVKNSQGKDVTTVYKYPFDNSSQSPYGSMVANKVSSPIIEQQEYVDNNGQPLLKSAVSTDYSAISQSLYKPVSIYKLENSKLLSASDYTTYANGLISRGNLFGISAQMKYNNKGNISEIKERDGMPTTYLWSYTNQYPVAKIVGLTYDEVSGIVGSTGVSNLAQNASPTQADIEAIPTKINNSGKNALVTTYTYLPSIGMTSMTDTRGVTTNYTYDTFNRLFLAHNDDKNIVGRYSYGYQNAPDNGHGGYLAPVATVTPGAASYLPGTTGTATLGSVSGGSGNYTYSWYLKNSTGTVLASNLNTTSTSFSFLCTQPGTLTIQCVITDNKTGLSSTASTTIFSGVLPVYGNFYTVSGYVYPYTSLYKMQNTVIFVLVFVPTSSPMNVGADYYVADVSAGFLPSSIRTISYTTGGRTWNITIEPSGRVYCRIVSGTSLPIGSAADIGTVSYNL